MALDVSKELHAGHEAAVEAWAESRCDEFESGRYEAVAAALRSAGDYDKAKECVGSMEHDRDCMSPKGSELQWTVDGANAILALRCCTQSDRHEDFYAHRSAETRAGLRFVTCTL